MRNLNLRAANINFTLEKCLKKADKNYYQLIISYQTELTSLVSEICNSCIIIMSKKVSSYVKIQGVMGT